MPEFSYCGDGFCRYLEPGFPTKDCLFERTTPDKELSLAISYYVTQLAKEVGVSVHVGPIFSIDSILSEFSKLDYLINVLGCIGIEMETAAVFKAASMVGVRAAALFSVSDVPIRSKTIYAGRSQEEKNYRKEIRSQVLAKSLLECLHSLDI